MEQQQTIRNMNKREAKILALETFANNVEILIESAGVSDKIRTSKDCDLINIAFEELADRFWVILTPETQFCNMLIVRTP